MISEQIQMAVQVTNANKSYRNHLPVLKDFNMNVPQGTIYGLLGSSGCGKTTMLSCIAGINKLNSGDVFVFGQRPGAPGTGIPGRRIGYMPQDFSLYPELFIKEILEYFGILNGMTRSEIGIRMESLKDFLDLPLISRTINTLSGGEKRRVSLAVCLLHEPPLLILDEPTVGVDPILRESIWSHLMEIVKKKRTTVIITTHYIEEARNAQTIGLMRGGRLLVENSPTALLTEYNATLLHEIVLRLCKEDTTRKDKRVDKNNLVQDAIDRSSFYTKTNFVKWFGTQNECKSELADKVGVTGVKFKQLTFNNENYKDAQQNPTIQQFVKEEHQGGDTNNTSSVCRSLQRIRAVSILNALIFWRSPLTLLMILVVPVLNLLVVNLTLGPLPKNLKFGLVNPEISNNLSACSSNNSRGKCGLDNMSCRFLAELPSDIILLESKTSVAEALSEVEKGNLWGYMEFPENYSNHMVDRFAHGLYAEIETLQGSTVNIRQDMSSYMAGAILQKSIYESFQNHVYRMLTDCDEDPRKADLPLNFRKPKSGSEAGSYKEFILSACMIINIYFLGWLSCIQLVNNDRTQGTLSRSKLSGLTHTETLMSYLIFNGFLVTIICTSCYIIMAYVFAFKMHGSSLTYFTLLFLNGIGGLSMGLMTAEVIYDMKDLLLVYLAGSLGSFTSCGVFWPLEGSPYWLRIFVECLPFTRSMGAIRSIAGRGWSITHSQVYLAFLFQILWICITTVISIIVRRIKEPHFTK